MDFIANWLWQGGIVAFVAAASLRALAGSRAQVRYVVCWAALAAVLTLPLVSVAAALAPASAVVASDAPVPRSLVLVPDAWWTSNTTIAALWVVWIAAQGIRLATATFALRGARRRCRPFPPALASQLVHWRQVKDEGRRACLTVSDDVRAAAVLGWGSPVIAVAPSLLDHLTAEELDRVVIHEWAHVRRRDDLVRVIEMAVQAIAGWHPAAWWLDRRLRAEREAACDEIAVAVTASAKSYAACLIKVAELPRARVKTLPALGAVSRVGLADRIQRIVRQTHVVSAARSRKLAAASVAALGLVSMSIGAMRLVETVVVSANNQDTRETPPPTVRAEGGLGAWGVGLADDGTARRSPAPPQTLPRVRRQTAAPAMSDLGAPQARPARAERGAGAPRGGASAPPDDQRPSASVGSAGAKPPGMVRTSPATVASVPDVVKPQAPSPTPQASHPPQPETADANVEPPPVNPTTPSHVAGQPASRWDAMASGGAAVGQGSKKAGLATAGFFTRLSKRIAGAF